MMNSDKLNLTWNEFENSTSTSFKDLLTDQDFVDVTLACDDDKQVKAHKVILSSCSPVLKKLLQANPHPHPLLYLSDVSHQQLQGLINFMYLGQAEVEQDELGHFMKLAGKFKIKGLAEVDNIASNDTLEEVKILPRSRIKSEPTSIKQMKQKLHEEATILMPAHSPSFSESNEFGDLDIYQSQDQFIPETMNVQEDQFDNAGDQENQEAIIEVNIKPKEYANTKAVRKSCSVDEFGKYCCDSCGFVGKYRMALWRHKKTAHSSFC